GSRLLLVVSCLVIRRPRRSPLFPYTTLFRSRKHFAARLAAKDRRLARREFLGEVAHLQNGFFIRPAPDRPRIGLFEKLAVRFPADRKSTRLNSSHVKISYAVFCLKKKKKDAN